MESSYLLMCLKTLFPLGGYTAAVVWLVYVIKFACKVKNRAGGQAVYDRKRAEIAFQGIIIALFIVITLYYIFLNN